MGRVAAFLAGNVLAAKAESSILARNVYQRDLQLDCFPLQKPADESF